MSDKAREFAKLYKRIDAALKLIDDLEMDIKEMLQVGVKSMSDYKFALQERYTEVEHLIKDAEGEIDYFEQELMTIEDTIEKIRFTFNHWGNEHETDEYVAKLNIAKEVYQYLIEGWHGEIDDLKGERNRLEETL